MGGLGKEDGMSLYRLRILSLGAGVQSSCLLLMSCVGLIDRIDLAIFADTGWESAATYQHLEWLTKEAEKAGIPVVTCGKWSIRDYELSASFRGSTFSVLPFHASLDDGKMLLKRQCTNHFKIQPIRKATRHALGLKPRQRAPKDCVEQWIGISTDERQRIWNYRPDRMQSVRFPLVEMGMSRWDCARWLKDNYGIVPPKSSCVGCPYHSNNEWRALSPAEFKDACEFDRAIRNKTGLRGQAYLHRSCRPLEEVDLRTKDEKAGQLRFDFVKDEKLNLFVRGVNIHG